MIKYGVDWPRHWAEFQIDLFLYRYPERAKECDCDGLKPEDFFISARKLLWPKFKWSEYSRMFVKAWIKHTHIAIMGHTCATKTFDFSYTVVAEYLADPKNTRVVCTTVGLDSLRNNLWANILTAIDTTSVRLPLHQRATDREVCHSEQHKDRKYCIKGIATGEDKKAQGRIQGQHAPRSIVIIDEAQQTGSAIYDASYNLSADPFFRCVYLGNPENPDSDYGNACEPENGWETVDVNHRMWKTRKDNGICIHLDGLQSPNYLAEKGNPYPYLVTREYIDAMRKDPGEDSKKWWAWVRGWWPPEGAIDRIFSQPIIKVGRKDIELIHAKPCASLDPGYGGDRCILEEGELGLLKEDPSLMAVKHVKTVEVPIKVGQNYKPEEYQIADFFIDYCKARLIQPDNCIIDGTARGAGVVAIIRRNWNMAVHKLEYAGAPSERLLLPGDRRPCSKLYDRKVSELWYAAAQFMGHGQFGNITKETGAELYGRQGMEQQHGPRRESKLMCVETKKEYKKRLKRSPDLGDASVQLVELIRRKGAKLKGQDEWFDMSATRINELASTEEDLYDENREFSYH